MICQPKEWPHSAMGKSASATPCSAVARTQLPSRLLATMYKSRITTTKRMKSAYWVRGHLGRRRQPIQ